MLSYNYRNISMQYVICLALLVLFPSLGRCANLEIHIFVKDIDNQPISAEKIKIEADGAYKDFVNKDGNYYLKGETSANKIDSFNIIIDFGKKSLNRDVRFKETTAKLNKTFTFYKAPDGIYNYTYLQKGLQYVNSPPYDKALAFYEAATNKSQLIPLDQYNVCLYYNYAVALINTYKYDDYDNYNKAINYLDMLNQLYGKNRKYFAAENISKERLVKDLEDLKNYKFKIERTNFLNEYQKAREQFKKGNFLEVVNIAENLLKVCMDNPKLCNSTDLNEDRFLTDIGVSYLMAAEIAEKQNKPKEDIITYLNNGQSALEKVKKLDLKIVKQNLQIISYMLKKYQ